MFGYNYLRKNSPAYISITVFVLALLFTSLLYFVKTNTDGSIAVIDVDNEPDSLSESEVVERYYAPLYPIQIGAVSLQASIADTPASRQKGLSNTPYLPEDIVKLFVFDTSDTWSFWMKDMNYAIDMMWVSEAGQVVHIEPSVQPETFPNTFQSPVPALYVIETVAGFAERNNISTSTLVNLPVR